MKHEFSHHGLIAKIITTNSFQPTIKEQKIVYMLELFWKKKKCYL